LRKVGVPSTFLFASDIFLCTRKNEVVSFAKRQREENGI